jgi:hypothetical protein
LRFGGGIFSKSSALEGYSASPFPTPGMAFLLLLGFVVKNGWAKRSGSVLAGAAGAAGGAFFTALFFFGGIILVLKINRNSKFKLFAARNQGGKHPFLLRFRDGYFYKKVFLR